LKRRIAASRRTKNGTSRICYKKKALTGKGTVRERGRGVIIPSPGLRWGDTWRIRKTILEKIYSTMTMPFLYLK